MSIKRVAVDTLAIMGGNIIFDKWIGKVEGSDHGFITVAPGIGMDDAVRAIVCVALVMVAHKFVKE